MIKAMKDRFTLIREYCKDKTVLDVGTVGDLEHHWQEKNKWVFWHLQEVAKKVVGIDIDEKSVLKIHELGCPNVIVGDAECYQFSEQFDVVTAGELIEHLNNPGLFLANMYKQLKPNGQIIITTPNTFSINYILRAFFFGRVPLFKEHVNAYTDTLLYELLRRYGFKVVKVHYSTESTQETSSLTVKLRNILLRFLTIIRPRWAEGLTVVAQKV